MSKPDQTAKGADWTQLLSDPDLISHLGNLLQAYRDAPPEKRDEVLLDIMRQIKKESPRAASTEDVAADSSESASAVETVTPPPFDPSEVSAFWSSPSEQDRRRYPRQKCFLAVEMQPEGTAAPLWGNLANTSMGGCFVETAAPVANGVGLRIGLWLTNDKVWVKGVTLNGIVTRSSPCFGVRVKFTGLEPNERETLRKFLKFIESSVSQYHSTDGYLARLKG